MKRKVKWERVFLLGIIVYFFVGTVCSIIDSHIDPYKFERDIQEEISWNF
ncbi:hypothetical protein Aargi30884_15850 [Amedibacterium intestinale]|uniref:Uncharacterized protein n=1 Tax=Amedibacterium intestinale TaxID=2583452 RepID=A0A6N4TKS9_9FIRM|nr:hypothetical protein [Amedibacterium intestinale]BBK22682.1 hypothetical protein Aargi30884_15850 [Amedibacterium intestinale]